jgi:hypothetical protein
MSLVNVCPHCGVVHTINTVRDATDPGPYAFIVLFIQFKIEESNTRHKLALDLFAHYTDPTEVELPAEKEAVLTAMSSAITPLINAGDKARSLSAMRVFTDADKQAVVEWMANLVGNMERYRYAIRAVQWLDTWLPILLPFQRIRLATGTLYIGLMSGYCTALAQETMALLLMIKNRSHVRGAQ